MPNTKQSPPEAQGQGANSYEQAQADVSRQQRRDLVAKVKELRRQAEGAKERARKAQQRFERAVVLLASEKPEREDWYEYPGALPRKVLIEASGLNTVALHRAMERFRKTRSTNGRAKRR